jgi:hypothetical protein
MKCLPWHTSANEARYLYGYEKVQKLFFHKFLAHHEFPIHQSLCGQTLLASHAVSLSFTYAGVQWPRRLQLSA